MTDEMLHYVGYFIGFQPRGTGTKKTTGEPWTSYDILFHHGDMTKSVRFTWFDNTETPVSSLMPGTVYRILYVMNEFTNKDGIECKSKKAIKINKSSGEKLGYQQSVEKVPATGSTATQPVADFDMVGFIAKYKEKYSPSDWNPYHFIVTVELTKTPGKKDMFLSYKEAFNSKVMGK